MTVVTKIIADVAGNPDFGIWRFGADLSLAADDVTLKSSRVVSVIPESVDGKAVLWVDLDPGPVAVEYKGITTVIEVPDSDETQDLLELLDAGSFMAGGEGFTPSAAYRGSPVDDVTDDGDGGAEFWVLGESVGSVPMPGAVWSNLVGKPELPVDVTTEGVANDGATNVTAAIQSVVTRFGGVRPISFPAGRYLLGDGGAGTNRVTMPSGTSLLFDKGSVVVVNGQDNQSGTSIFYAGGTEGTKDDLDADTAAGDQTVTLPSGVAATLSVGDLISFQSDNIWGTNATTTFRSRELRQVEWVDGNDVVLDAPLDWAYTTADNARYFIVTPVEDIYIEGARFEPGPDATPGTDVSYAIRLRNSLNCVLRDISLHNMIGGVGLSDSYSTRIDGLLVDRLPQQTPPYAGSGYGLLAAGCTTQLVVDGLWGRECRHVFTTLGTVVSATEINGGPQYVNINGAIGFGGSNGGTAVFDTHQSGRHIYFNNCVANGGDPTRVTSPTGPQHGFQIRSQYTVLNNCSSFHAGSRAVTFTDTLVAHCRVQGGEFAFSKGNAGVGLGGDDIQIIGAHVHDNAGWGISPAADSNLVQDCLVVNNGGLGIGLTAVDSTNTIIKGCTIPYSAAQPNAINAAQADTIITDCINLGFGSGGYGLGLFNLEAGARYLDMVGDNGTYSNEGVIGPAGKARVVYEANNIDPTINCDTTDLYYGYAIAGDIRGFTVTGTPTEGQRLVVRLVGTAARGITWGSQFRGNLLSTTVSTLTNEQELRYDDLDDVWVGGYNNAAGY